jgi:nitroimidazol reductase NimA-like FMN-containing flavoprotein (pyridoxamine 5'-phosphate oxidase superfamily)
MEVHQADGLAAMCRQILDRIAYLTLATTDADGTPRATPLYFSPHRYTDLYWVSRPDAQHSLNIATDDRVRALIFDSTIPVGDGEAVTATGRARQVPETELADHVPVAFRDFPGTWTFTVEELSRSAALRLYVLRVDTWEATVGGDHPRFGTGKDRRVPVAL